MIHETSAGIVIFRQLPGGREYLLLHYPKPGGHFDFAKGHLEKGETEREAAYRELKEETGLQKIIWIEGFREKIHYFHVWKGQKMSKDVIFFLARTTQKKVTISFEHQGAVWLPYEEALQTITFDNSQNVLKKAEQFLRKSEKKTSKGAEQL